MEPYPPILISLQLARYDTYVCRVVPNDRIDIDNIIANHYPLWRKYSNHCTYTQGYLTSLSHRYSLSQPIKQLCTDRLFPLPQIYGKERKLFEKQPNYESPHCRTFIRILANTMVAGSNSRKDMELATYKHSYDGENRNGKSHIPNVEVARATNGSKHAESNPDQQQDDENYNWFCKLELCTYLNIAFFAIVGCLIRLGFDYLLGAELANVENSSSIIFQSFFANMLGSFILGVLSTSLLKEIKQLSSLSTGISTGI